MDRETTERITKVHTIRKDVEDDLFVCFASFEERCLGVVSRFDSYAARKSLILKISDEHSSKREENVKKLFKGLKKVSYPSVILTEHRDPIVGMKRLAETISSMTLDRHSSAITIDISTFTKKQLFLVLRLFDNLELFDSIRLLYTEPLQYAINLEQPLSYGLKEIAVIPTFAGDYDPQGELTLIIFLGYEGDRALALWENIEPHKTIAVIPNPPYRKEWEGKTEQLNSAILSAIENNNIYHSSSLDPFAAQKLLEKLIMGQAKAKQNNWYIAPLGTKIQCVGIYYFIRKYAHVASLIYAKPLQHNEAYFSDGIGRTWQIPK